LPLTAGRRGAELGRDHSSIAELDRGVLAADAHDGDDAVA